MFVDKIKVKFFKRNSTTHNNVLLLMDFTIILLSFSDLL